MELEFIDWGLIPYKVALHKQLELVEKVFAENLPGYLIFCHHPPIVTLGRATKDGDVFDWNGPVIEVSRGGRATYHGPSQQVVYPIINLNYQRKGRIAHEVQGYLRVLEEAIVLTLQEFGIQSTGKSLQKKEDDSKSDETGVWIGARKIASLGIAVKNWVTYHGAAINIEHDVRAFKGINPCGLSAATMTDMEQVLGFSPDREAFSRKLKSVLCEVL